MSAPRIRQLDAHTANQIAAGEVVARPASVIKELVENALDAEATSIVVSIEGGGLRSMRVRDDGTGMTEEDARMAIERHATSKLRSADDLQALTTLGFRGEALPSIASVSRFRMQTRPRDQDAGTELLLTGGQDLRIGPCGCAPGTIIEVAELFFNVPARKKFMRAVATESAHISDVVRAVALAHPEVAIQLERDGRKHRRWAATDSRRTRAEAVYSDYSLFAVEGQRGPVQVQAYLSAPERARSGTGGLQVLVNRRPVGDRAIARAIASGYGQRLERGRYPVGVIFVDIDPALLDVNVHPQKAEVRFAHARAVSDAVYAIVGDAMAKELGATPSRQPHRFHKGPAPTKEEGDWSWPAASTPAASVEVLADSASGPTALQPTRGIAVSQHRDSNSASSPTPPSLSTQARREPAPAPDANADLCPLRWVATIAGFWLCHDGDNLVFIDAARLLRATTEAQLVAAYESGNVPAQRQLFPLRKELDQTAVQRIEDNQAKLERLGFDVRVVAAGVAAVHSLPLALSEVSPDKLLSTLLDSTHWDQKILHSLCELLLPQPPESLAAIGKELAAWWQLPEAQQKPALRHRLNLERLR